VEYLTHHPNNVEAHCKVGFFNMTKEHMYPFFDGINTLEGLYKCVQNFEEHM